MICALITVYIVAIPLRSFEGVALVSNSVTAEREARCDVCRSGLPRMLGLYIKVILCRAKLFEVKVGERLGSNLGKELILDHLHSQLP